mgnify:CR=1 FL=1
MSPAISRATDVAALAALAPSFIAGQLTPQGLAIAIGGILFAGRAINTICGGIAGLARAAVAWDKAAPLLRAETFYRYQIMIRTRAISRLSQLLGTYQINLVLPDDLNLVVDIDPTNLV